MEKPPGNRFTVSDVCPHPPPPTPNVADPAPLVLGTAAVRGGIAGWGVGVGRCLDVGEGIDAACSSHAVAVGLLLGLRRTAPHISFSAHFTAAWEALNLRRGSHSADVLRTAKACLKYLEDAHRSAQVKETIPDFHV